MKATPEGIALLMKQLEELSLDPAAPIKPPPPPLPPERKDDNGGDMDIWQQSVETRLGELSSRMLWLAGGIGSSFVILLTVFLTQLGSTNGRVDNLGDRMAKVEAGLERVDERTIAMQKQMDGMDAKLDKLLSK